MYTENEKVQKKLINLVKNAQVIFITTTILIAICLLLIILANSELLNLVLILLFAVVWFSAFSSIYSLLAFKIPTQVQLSNNTISIKCIKKTYDYSLSEFLERGEGVNNIILKFKKGNKIYKYYVPQYYGSKRILDKNAFKNFPNVRNVKVNYDFFLRFF